MQYMIGYMAIAGLVGGIVFSINSSWKNAIIIGVGWPFWIPYLLYVFHRSNKR